ncbi:MAG: YraN family protein [Candidatus Riflebacteria bacterium]|nr:YraN family protein [Candidatus Riflebacteria bacterium]
MTGRRELGLEGERAAADILRTQGFRIREVNFRTRFGELDIVAEEGEYLCFIEVRLRSGSSFGTAAESLTAKKREHLVAAARLYLAARGCSERPCRFDLLALEWDRRTGSVRSHSLIRDAFGVER